MQKFNDSAQAICENLGWTVTVDEDGGIELGKYSPAGEDFSFSVEAEKFFGEVREYANDFDIDEHIAMWIEARRNGVAGVPTTRELVKDAERISEMLGELADALAEAKESEGGAE